VLATAGDQAVRLWDVRTGKKLRETAFRGRLASFAYFAQGGRTLICSAGTDSEIYLLEAASLKTRATIRLGEPALSSVAISADGTLLGVGLMRRVTLWDVATGKPRGSVRVTPTNRYAVSVVALAFAQDGRTMAAAMRDPFARICDVKIGKELRRSQPPGLPSDFRMRYLAFLPRSKVLATGSLRGSCVYLWDAEKGTLVRKIQLKIHALPPKGFDEPRREEETGLEALAISPDGKTIAGACHDRQVRLWEVATGGLRRQTSVLATEMAFAPVGSLLAMATPEKGAIRLWDWRDPDLKRPLRLTARALEGLWDRLADRDAGAAYLAIAALAANPKQATTLLAKRLRRVEPMPAKEVDRNIAALDSDDFEARQRAFKRLEALGKGAEVKLRAAVAKGKSLELRKQAKELLRRMGRMTPERLRAIRSIEVLEYLGTPQAKRVLARLAEGAAGALETEDAKAALKRLNLLKTSASS
jgi:hypothetical protein